MSQAPPPSNLPNVAKAGGIMVLSLTLSRFLGLIRDMIIAGKFGSNADTDAYRLSFQIPDLLFFLIAGGALSSAFIPVFSEYLHTGREKDAWKVFSVVTTLMSLLLTAVILMAWIFAPQLATLVAPGKVDDPGLIPLITYMSRVLLPAQFAFFIGGLMFGTLYARQVFAVPGLGPNVYNLGIIFGAVALSGLFTPGVIGMSWGALLGAVAGNLLIPYAAMRKLGMDFRFDLDLKHPGVRKVFRLMLPVVLGLSLPGVYALIMQVFGSYFQAGVNTWLEYSNRLMQVPLGIFGQSLAIAVFPALTQFFAQQRPDLFSKQLTLTLRQVIYFTVPVAAFMAVAAPQIVAALYQHGRFRPEDTEAVAACLRWFAIGIPAWCLHPVLMRAFFAKQRTIGPIVLGTATTALFVALVLWLWQTSLGFLALPLAGSVSAIALVIALVALMSRSEDRPDTNSMLATLGKSLFASALFAAVTWAVLQTPVGAVTTSNKLLSVLAVLAFAVPGAVLYAWITRRMGMQELSYVDRAWARLTRRGAPAMPPTDEGTS